MSEKLEEATAKVEDVKPEPKEEEKKEPGRVTLSKPSQALLLSAHRELSQLSYEVSRSAIALERIRKAKEEADNAYFEQDARHNALVRKLAEADSNLTRELDSTAFRLGLNNKKVGFDPAKPDSLIVVG